MKGKTLLVLIVAAGALVVACGERGGSLRPPPRPAPSASFVSMCDGDGEGELPVSGRDECGRTASAGPSPLPRDNRVTVLPNVWTLCYEEQFYALAALLLWLAPRRMFLAASVLTIAASQAPVPDEG